MNHPRRVGVAAEGGQLGESVDRPVEVFPSAVPMPMLWLLKFCEINAAFAQNRPYILLVSPGGDAHPRELLPHGLNTSNGLPLAASVVADDGVAVVSPRCRSWADYWACRAR